MWVSCDRCILMWLYVQAERWFLDLFFHIWLFRSWGVRIRENIKLTLFSFKLIPTKNKIIHYGTNGSSNQWSRQWIWWRILSGWSAPGSPYVQPRVRHDWRRLLQQQGLLLRGGQPSPGLESTWVVVDSCYYKLCKDSHFRRGACSQSSPRSRHPACCPHSAQWRPGKSQIVPVMTDEWLVSQVDLTCHSCQHHVRTNTKSGPSTLAWALCCCLCVIGMWDNITFLYILHVNTVKWYYPDAFPVPWSHSAWPGSGWRSTTAPTVAFCWASTRAGRGRRLARSVSVSPCSLLLILTVQHRINTHNKIVEVICEPDIKFWSIFVIQEYNFLYIYLK